MTMRIEKVDRRGLTYTETVIANPRPRCPHTSVFPVHAGRGCLRPLFALLFCGLLGCSSSSTPAEPGPAPVADDADLDVRATSEEKAYDITATLSITLIGADAALTGDARTAKMQDLAREKIDTVTRALDTELAQRWPDAKSVVAVLRTTTPKRRDFHLDPDDAATSTFGYWAQVASAIAPTSMATKVVIGRETVTLGWAPAGTASDAYPRYGELFADGLDVAVSGDDGSLRDALASLPSSVLVAGQRVDVRVTFTDDFASAAKAADVVVYRDRAAPSMGGIVLSSKTQLFVFDGADSYTASADAVLDASGDADVVTTDDAAALVRALVGESSWTPKSWQRVLDESSGGRRVHLVRGITDGPKISMLADVARIGEACRANTDCGAADSLCIAGACGAACADDSGCPQGKTCAAVSSKVLGPIRQCL